MKCEFCGKEIEFDLTKSLRDQKRKRFCNRSCSASYNNIKFPKRATDKVFCLCGARKDSKAIRCHQCKVKEAFLNNENKTLSDVLIKGNARVKFSYVRKLARQAIEVWNWEKKCKLCSFEFYDVCHIKGLADFSNDTLIRDINSKENLVCLCPNHHLLLDRGLIKL